MLGVDFRVGFGSNSILVDRAAGDDDLVTNSAGSKILPVILWEGDTSMMFACEDELTDDLLIPNSSFQENRHKMYLSADCFSAAKCNNDLSLI